MQNNCKLFAYIKKKTVILQPLSVKPERVVVQPG